MFLEATKHLPRPLLLLDGNRSHFEVEILELAVKKGSVSKPNILFLMLKIILLLFKMFYNVSFF